MEIPVSPGELLDKISILEIKEARLSSGEQRRHVAHELRLLVRVRDKQVDNSPELSRLTAALRQVNGDLWEIEDTIRACEREGDFGAAFVALARSVYHKNDARSALKRRINVLLQSDVVEEKRYTAYQPEVSGEWGQA